MKTGMKGGLLEKAPGVWLIKISAGPDPKKPGRYLQRHEVFRGNKTEAKARRAELQAQAKKGDTLDGRKLTVKQWIEHWLSKGGGSDQNVSRKTHERYGQLMNLHVVPTLGAKRIRDLKAAQIEELYGTLREAGELAGRTIRHVHTVFRTCLNEANRLDVIASNPMEKVRPPKVNAAQTIGGEEGEPEKGKVLSAKEINTLIKGATRFDLQALVALAAASGARLGELLALRWSDLGHNSGNLRIERSVENTAKYGPRLKVPKTPNSKRTIGLDAGIVDILRKRRVRQAEEALAVGVALPADALMFPKSILEPTGLRNIPDVDKQFKKVATAVKLGHHTLHHLRHSHGSHLLDHGVPLPAVSARLGHSSVAVTAAIYSHEIKRAEDRSVEVTNSLFRSTLADL